MELWWSSWYLLIGVLEKLVELDVILDYRLNIGEPAEVLAKLVEYWQNIGGILVEYRWNLKREQSVVFYGTLKKKELE